MEQATEESIMRNWRDDASEPIVSIYCITYNQEEFISDALNSFLSQKTNFSFEIVIDDNCSTDRTAEIIKKYQKDFPKIIKANFRNKNVGMHENAKGCFYRTQGCYVAYCEGDDYWIDTNKLQYQFDKMNEFPECDISFHPVEIKLDRSMPQDLLKGQIENKNNHKFMLENKRIIRAKYSNADTIYDIDTIINDGGGFCPSRSIMVKKSIFHNTKNERALFGHFFMQVLGSVSGGALYINKTMSVYRMHSKGIQSSQNINSTNEHTLQLANYFSEIDKFLNYKYNQKFSFIFSRWLLASVRNSNFNLIQIIKLYQQYYHYWSNEVKKDFLTIIKNDIMTNSDLLNSTEIDMIRDEAGRVEKSNINLAHDLMFIAHLSRPTGPFIKKKYELFKKILNKSKIPLSKNDINNNDKKIFCISIQRTGTTSVGKFFQDFGFNWAGWPSDLKNMWSIDWYEGNYEKIFASDDFKSANAFEDSPWFFPEFYKILYHKFPNAKFILFIRDSDAWFQSMIKHSEGNILGIESLHSKVYRREEEYYNLVDAGELKDDYMSQAKSKRVMKLIGHNEHYKKIYELHNREVKDFFSKHSPNSLFISKLEDSNKWVNLGKFLNIEVEKNYNVHENKS